MYKIPLGSLCERGNDLVAYLYGEIDEPVARDFERHLLNCPDCEAELDNFKGIRSSVGAWRQESLGGAAASFLSSPVVERASHRNKPSAMAAIREFLALSPLWMKASIAFASVLFCVFSVLAFARVFESPKLLVSADQRRYTEQELQAKIEDAVAKSKLDLEAPKTSVESSDGQHVTPPRKGTNRSGVRVASHKGRRGPLTRLEREQLAADLRLTTPQDDTELDLLGDGNNE